jgi:diaminohydroxyphosphoribosylaminopyrimidine deaminase/5-amino-6-(5-phosphoribosylamino)uracil reductase
MDNNLRMPLNSRLVKTANKQPVIVVTYSGSVDAGKTKSLEKAGVEVLTFGDLQGKSNLAFVLDELSKRDVQQLLVEGGPKIIASFLREDLADELCVYIAPKFLGNEGSADISQALADLNEKVSLHHIETKVFDSDVRIRGFTSQGTGSYPTR